MNPLVSVIIPCFNAEKTLRETIESALQQTYHPHEVIVVDDGSLDTSVDIARSFGEKIKLIQKENGGPSSARNAGIMAGKGEFIAFLDADDTWLPQKSERQVGVLLSHPSVGLVHSGYLRLEEGSNTITPKILHDHPVLCRSFREMYMGVVLVGTVTVMIRRAMMEEIGLFDENPEIQGAEDFDMWLRIADQSEIAYIPEILARYRVSFSGHSRSNISRAHASTQAVRSKHEALFRTRYHATDQEVLTLRANSSFREGLSFFHLGDNIGAKEHFFTAVRARPWHFKSLLYFFLCCARPSTINWARHNRILVALKQFLTAKRY